MFDFVWVDDFAAARNEAMARATGCYVFWLDADAVIDPLPREKSASDYWPVDWGRRGRVCPAVACDPPDGNGGETVVDHIRLFPLRQDVRWTYRVHEQILPSLRRAKVRSAGPTSPSAHGLYRSGLEGTEARPRHHDPSTRAGGPAQRSVRAVQPGGRSPLSERTGMVRLGFWSRAWPARRRPTRSRASCLPRSPGCTRCWATRERPSGPSRRGCGSIRKTPSYGSARGSCIATGASRRRPSDCWGRILSLKRPDQFCSVDQGIHGHLTRRNLAALAAERGDHAGAGKLWAEVLAECPGDREALKKLERP